MNILTDKQLNNLSTARLLELKRQLNKVVGRRRHDVESKDVETTKEDFQVYHQYVDFSVRLKDILSEREHLERPRGPKHNHDKRQRREGAIRKRGH